MSNALLIYFVTQAMDNNRICHPLLFHERGNIYSVNYECQFNSELNYCV